VLLLPGALPAGGGGGVVPVDPAGYGGKVKDYSVTFITFLDYENVMGEEETIQNPAVKLNQVKNNLNNWNFYEWVIFWVIIPAVLILIYTFPQNVKDEYFIFNTSHLARVQTYFLSSYTHLQLYWHLIGNLAFYFVTLLMIFAFENNKRRFWLLATWAFCVVPFIGSFLTLGLWRLISRDTAGQGFSGINGAFLAYAIFIFSVWGMKEFLEIVDHPEMFKGSRIRFQIAKIGMNIIIAMIILMGFIFGQFLVADGSTVNGIVHFGGFFSSLIILLVFDIMNEKRMSFDLLLGIFLLIGIVGYSYYLIRLIGLINSL
jgi:hypothetical protein